MNKLLFFIVLIVRLSFGEVVSPVKIWAEVISFDQKMAVLKIGKRRIRVPRDLLLDEKVLRNNNLQMILFKEEIIELL